MVKKDSTPPGHGGGAAPEEWSQDSGGDLAVSIPDGVFERRKNDYRICGLTAL